VSPRARLALLLAAAGGGLALIFWKRNEIVTYGGKAIDAANEWLFRQVLPAPASSYADVILRVAREEGLDPFLLYAIGARESGWGIYLTPPNPSGKGDGGRGHGIMQIDSGSFGPWLASNPWWDPYVNVKKGAQVWKAKRDFLAGQSQVRGLTTPGYVHLGATAASRRGVAPGAYRDPRPLSGDALIRAATAAYNTGEGNVLASVAVGLPPDATTTGRDYAADVTSRWALVADRFAQAAGA
jgi:hypothetical protein